MDTGYSQKIQIFISARSLKDLDYFSKSDPYVKVSFRRDFNAKSYILLGRTETLNNNLNPTFQKSFTIDYIFESKQDIKFQVMDDDNGNDDFLGSVETTVGALMGAKSQTSLHDIKCQEKISGKLIIRCQKVTETSVYYNMKWRAMKLANTDSFFDFWDKSDPFLKFLKIREDNTYIEAFRTQYINNNLNPSWPQFEIASTKLHNENSTKFKLQCWDWEEDGNNKFIGQCFPDAKQIVQNNVFPRQISLTNPKNQKPGSLVLQQFQILKKPSFIQYLRGGLQLNLIVAIDFTGSNGIPTNPSSLHYMDHHKPNQYQSTITAVSQIILNYDSDKRIPSFGFGAKPKYPGGIGSQVVSHCFPLSGNANQIDTFGYQHLMSTYCKAISNVQLAGPTYFKPIIEQAMKIATTSRNSGSNTYQILLILTDGQIHDMQPTIDLLVNNANLPISIIIVGVGEADFANMSKLDGDNGLYGSNGQKAMRDIVQFVPFRDVKMNPDLLAKELLAQLPGQVVQYMTLIGKPPNPPLQADLGEILGPTQPTNNIGNQQVANMFEKGNFFGGGQQNISNQSHNQHNQPPHHQSKHPHNPNNSN